MKSKTHLRIRMSLKSSACKLEGERYFKDPRRFFIFSDQVIGKRESEGRALMAQSSVNVVLLA